MLYDTFRAVKSRWFVYSALGTLFFLWMGIGSESARILRDSTYSFEITDILSLSLMSESSVLSLPALAALPTAATALSELRCGAARNAIFRAGRKKYLTGKIVSLLLPALLAQLLGLALFAAILLALRGTFDTSAINTMSEMMAARLVVSGAFACLGAVFALITGAPAAAYVAPMAVCYTLKLVAGRFLVGVPYINPADWLRGDDTALLLASVLCVVFATAFGIALKKEMSKFA